MCGYYDTGVRYDNSRRLRSPSAELHPLVKSNSGTPGYKLSQRCPPALLRVHDCCHRRRRRRLRFPSLIYCCGNLARGGTRDERNNWKGAISTQWGLSLNMYICSLYEVTRTIAGSIPFSTDYPMKHPLPSPLVR